MYRIHFDYLTGEFAGITDTDRTDWGKAYPAVDIDGEIDRARQWLIDNPAKRKKQVSRFLTNWLARCQERGGSGQPKAARGGKQWA